MAEEPTSSTARTVRPNSSLDDVTREWLQSRLKDIEEHTHKDVLTIYGGISPGLDISVRMAIEGLRDKGKTLLVILHTQGGIVEEVRNIVEVLRHHYDNIHFLVPVCAMSAGTVLVMSGDEIYMDYFSRLGPIDPQIQTNQGERMVPALSYLRQYEKLIEKSRTEPLTVPELALLNKLDLAELHQLELAGNLSVSLIEDWLVRYKFRNWEVNHEPVDDETKRIKAKEIAEKLNDHEKWYTHGNSIHKDILEKDFKMKIKDYSEGETLKKSVWEYFWAVVEYTDRVDYTSFVHTREFI